MLLKKSDPGEIYWLRPIPYRGSKIAFKIELGHIYLISGDRDPVKSMTTSVVMILSKWEVVASKIVLSGN